MKQANIFYNGLLVSSFSIKSLVLPVGDEKSVLIYDEEDKLIALVPVDHMIVIRHDSPKITVSPEDLGNNLS